MFLKRIERRRIPRPKTFFSRPDLHTGGIIIKPIQLNNFPAGVLSSLSVEGWGTKKNVGKGRRRGERMRFVWGEGGGGYTLLQNKIAPFTEGRYTKCEEASRRKINIEDGRMKLSWFFFSSLHVILFYFFIREIIGNLIDLSFEILFFHNWNIILILIKVKKGSIFIYIILERLSKQK